MPKFSVIVAVYNIENYIDQCIESLVGQNYDDLEIITVNDGSTDRSLDKLYAWQRRYNIIKIVDKPNGGLSSARNAGLKVATGEYISYVDGDDWVSKDMFNIISKALSETKADIICFSYYNYYSEKNTHRISTGLEDGLILSGKEYFRRSNFCVTAWSKVYRKDFLLNMQLHFNEGRLHEDIPYTIPLCMAAQKVISINRPLYYYRQNRYDSIMNKIKDRNVNDYIFALCFGFWWLKDRNLQDEYYRQWLVHSFYFSCLTHQTTFSTLRKYMLANNADKIVNEIGGTTKCHFLIKLFFTHHYMKTRAVLGALIHNNQRR